jgi:hypothetical protein
MALTKVIVLTLGVLGCLLRGESLVRGRVREDFDGNEGYQLVLQGTKVLRDEATSQLCW